MTRIFFRGNKIEGSVLPVALAGILVVSIIMSGWYSFAKADYEMAKKALNQYYEKLDSHNAAVVSAGQNEMNNGGVK